MTPPPSPRPFNAAGYFKAFACMSLLAMALFLLADFWILILLVVILFLILSLVRLGR